MIAWIGTIGGILGAFLVAFGFAFVGYVAFIIGASCCLYNAIKAKDTAMAVQFGFFFCANIIGLIRN